jgi:serine/threonine-protein kinase
VRDTLRAILAEVSTSPSIAPPARNRRRALIGATVGTAALLVAVIVMSDRWRPARPPSTPASAGVALTRSIAVLPFENMNRDSTTDYFGDGLAEELISALGRLPGLRVSSRTSTFALKGRNTGLADVGKRLIVSSVLESSVRREGDVVRITTRLVDVGRDSVLWAGEYTGQLRNVLYVQDSIARAIAVALSGALAGDPGVASTPPRSRDPDAYEDYLRGRRYLRQRKPGSMTAAIRSFEAAIARDSTFALAYAGLADAYSLAAPFESRPPHEVFPLAKKAATRALSLDSTLAEAHTSLGMVSMFYDWDWATAGLHLRRGVELNPSSAEGHLFYTWYLVFRGRLRDADAQIARAYDVDPLSPVIATRRGNILSYQGRNAEAIRSYRHALELDSTFFFARTSLAAAFILTGQRDSARAVVPRRSVQTGTGESAYPAWVLAQLGDTAGVRQELETYLAIRRRGYISADGLAGVYAVLGDTVSALAQLEQAERDHGFTLPFIPRFPMLDGIRQTERYRRLIERVGVIPP